MNETIEILSTKTEIQINVYENGEYCGSLPVLSHLTGKDAKSLKEIETVTTFGAYLPDDHENHTLKIKEKITDFIHDDDAPEGFRTNFRVIRESPDLEIWGVNEEHDVVILGVEYK